uniref:Transmembrane protein n=1 Tax=Chromera velia CCMP2878 TaxID=1169474 RepID=A0A0G4HDH9_9ALVE|eukprot:Cvel_26516.t1-p1 / transcript=Cvel_26516.t1 / gene=Cvel_26516 / organism=Chromera_velia_CCMP2878 / gene_product=hypothetical protein / transcript_product=hypothetical protein / location=Cvel_scaffold3166:228-11966(+) / protein_length=227 / sequence_SO=supercontig / SO=protein_coding / is_pseudo=false
MSGNDPRGFLYSPILLFTLAAWMQGLVLPRVLSGLLSVFETVHRHQPRPRCVDPGRDRRQKRGQRSEKESPRADQESEQTGALAELGGRPSTEAGARTGTKKLETWQEVDMNRPRVPKVEDYVRPKKAPDPNQLTREQFRQFMRGKPQRFSVELQQFIGAWIILGFISSEVMLTLYIMRPDDFEWVEEERARLEAAKRKMARLQQYQENLAAKRAAEEEGASASAGV